MTKCEWCTQPHDGSYGSGRFCKQPCARAFSTSLDRKGISDRVRKTFLSKTLSPEEVEERVRRLTTEDVRSKASRSATAMWIQRWALTKDKRLAELFVVGKLQMGQRLKRWLIRDGYKQDLCEVCGLGPEWHGQPITLELDHINGNRMDNRLHNLRIICPNCHSQTATYKWKNSKTVKPYKVSIRTQQEIIHAPEALN